jgi:hypothetical protein
MDRHDASELIRKLGKLLDDYKQEASDRANTMTWHVPRSGKKLAYLEGEISGLRTAIVMIKGHVTDDPVKRTTLEALRIGGWFYFVGTIQLVAELYPIKTHGMYIEMPAPGDNTDDPVVPFWGQWLLPSRFNGDWYGPISPPVQSRKTDA